MGGSSLVLNGPKRLKIEKHLKKVEKSTKKVDKPCSTLERRNGCRQNNKECPRNSRGILIVKAADLLNGHFPDSRKIACLEFIIIKTRTQSTRVYIHSVRTCIPRFIHHLSHQPAIHIEYRQVDPAGLWQAKPDHRFIAEWVGEVLIQGKPDIAADDR